MLKLNWCVYLNYVFTKDKIQENLNAEAECVSPAHRVRALWYQSARREQWSALALVSTTADDVEQQRWQEETATIGKVRWQSVTNSARPKALLRFVTAHANSLFWTVFGNVTMKTLSGYPVNYRR